jgi:hypothetical protein
MVRRYGRLSASPLRRLCVGLSGFSVKTCIKFGAAFKFTLSSFCGFIFC